MLLGVQTFHVLKTVQKCKKSLKTENFCKMMVIFEFLTLKLVKTVFKHLRKCSLFFFLCRGVENFLQNKKKKKWSV